MTDREQLAEAMAQATTRDCVCPVCHEKPCQCEEES